MVLVRRGVVAPGDRGPNLADLEVELSGSILMGEVHFEELVEVLVGFRN